MIPLIEGENDEESITLAIIPAFDVAEDATPTRWAGRGHTGNVNEEDSTADPQFTAEPSPEPTPPYYSLIVKYVDTDGNLIIEPIVEDGKQEGRSYTTTMKLSPEAPDGNASTISSRDGWVCFYVDGMGLCEYAADGNAHILVPLEEIRVDDQQSLDSTNIWCFDVCVENDVAVFYDNTLKCIRCVCPLP